MLLGAGAALWVQQHLFVVSTKAYKTKLAYQQSQNIFQAHLLCSVLACNSSLMHRKFVTLHRLASLGTLAAGLLHSISTVAMSYALQCRSPNESVADRYIPPDIERTIRISHEGFTQICELLKSCRHHLENDREESLHYLSVLISDTSDFMKPYLDLHRINLQVVKESSAGLCKIRCDGCSFKQVLANIIMNSVESLTDESSREIFVHFSYDEKTKTARLTVTDSGCGISAENISAIWQPFFTTKKEGSGLGLAFVKEVVEEQMRGKVTITSSLQKGTSVSMEFAVV